MNGFWAEVFAGVAFVGFQIAVLWGLPLLAVGLGWS